MMTVTGMMAQWLKHSQWGKELEFASLEDMWMPDGCVVHLFYNLRR